MTGASIAAIGINVLVAITCIFVRFVRERRDWLTPLAANFGSMIASWVGLLFVALQALNPLLVLLSVLRLYERRAGSVAETVILAGGVAALACLWLSGAFLPAFAAGQGLALLIYVVVGVWLCLGPTAFYRLVGATLVVRGVYAGSIVYFSLIHRDAALLETLVYVNIIFVTASGFGSLLIEFDDTRLELAAANAAKTNFLAKL
jgi:hypothetical protein